MNQDLIKDFGQSTHLHETRRRMRLSRRILHALREDDAMWCPDLDLRGIVHWSRLVNRKHGLAGFQLTDHSWRAYAGVLHRGGSTKVQRHHLIPEITTPEEPVPDLNVLVTQMRGARVLATINGDP